MKTERRFHVLDYGLGALIVIVASIGFAAVIYGLNLIPFNFFNLPAWVFCPLGVYTLFYSLFAHMDPFYYAVWGAVMLALGVVSASYTMINPLLVLGILLIIIAATGIAAYKRNKS
ncbi:MAG: hypothetical protein RMJ15_06505 [Nitrososphaerota archaeon]|nr:hypothetical protein [Candidatus Bathyarchaeota archaeon]MDW8023370.1 hypothetical protein [Nitrososphaerota archaeon]